MRWLALNRFLVLTVLTSTAGCSEPAASELEPDATTSPPDGAPTADAPTVVEPSCAGPFTYSRSESEVTAALEALRVDVQSRAPDAYYAERIDGTKTNARLTSIRATLDVPAGTDPRDAAIAWLAATSPDTFRAAEWRIDPTEPALEPGATTIASRMIRTAVDDLPWPTSYPDRFVWDGALSLVLDQRAAGWTLQVADLSPTTVMATRADARLLAACLPPTPPPASALRATTVTGLELVACSPTGTYTYTPGPADGVTALEDLGWQLTFEVDAAGYRRWRPVRTVTLDIDPANYWPTIERADCWCHDRTGFTYAVDALTGEVLRVTPGINCVVC